MLLETSGLTVGLLLEPLEGKAVQRDFGQMEKNGESSIETFTVLYIK